MKSLKLGTYYMIGLLAMALLSSCKQSAGKPNVIVVITDDQGWGDVGYNGNQMIHTPTIDSLAAKSVVIDRFYVSPVCAPTRASLLTGKDHLSTGVSWVTRRKEVMRESEVTIAEIFRDNNYKTAYFGKWHNGAQYPHTPNGQGFDHFFGFCGGHLNSYFNTQLEWNAKTVNTEGYITDVLTDSIIKLIGNTDEPYLAILAYNTPHTPYQVEDKYYYRYKKLGLDDRTSAIYGMVENIDYNMHRLLSALEKNKQLDNTILVFMSDNGPNFVRYNGGLKGRKAQVDEGGVRVPFIIHYPNGKFANRKIKEGFARHMDVMPTLMELCGIPAKDNIQGVSFASSLKKRIALHTDEALFSHQVLNEGGDFISSVRTNGFLLTCLLQDTLLFNLIDDPFQMMDVINENPVVKDSLIALQQGWISRYKGVHQEYLPIVVGPENKGVIDFPAHEGIKSNNLDYAFGAGWANDWTVSWDSISDSLYWKIIVEEDCMYDVDLLYSCSRSDVGCNLVLRTSNNSHVVQINHVPENIIPKCYDRVKRAEAPERIWGALKIGNIAFTKSDNVLMLQFKDNRKSNLEIKGITLQNRAKI